MKTINVETMAKHYLNAAFWADKPEGTNPRVTKQALKIAKNTCWQFSEMIIKSNLFDELSKYPEYWQHPDCNGHIEAAIGHDLYLTSAGHGVGFWDRDTIPRELGEKLSALCGWRKPIPEPEVNFYRGWMYL